MRAHTLFLITLGCALFAAAGVRAADYPVRPVRIVIGFTPGGTPDITARLIGVKLSESFGQQIVVDNHPGAGGTIGARLVAEQVAMMAKLARAAGIQPQ
jgi:tripartite-type tricarboxylate transporter receptor subunit TctC